MAQFLGYLGVLPFLAGAVLLWLPLPDIDPFGQQLLLIYGGLILSFLGGVDWGVALAREEADPGLFVGSVIPSLIGLTALMLQTPISALMLILGFVAVYFRHREIAQDHSFSQWFMRLRLHLSLAAIACLTAGLLAP